MTRLIYDARWIGAHGIGRFARELRAMLGPDREITSETHSPSSPADPLWLSRQLAALHDEDALFYSPGYNAPLRAPCRYVFTIHDLIHLSPSNPRRAMYWVYYSTVVRRACQRAAQIVTVSQHSKQEIARFFAVPTHKIAVVGNGISAEFTPQGRVHAPGHPYVFCPGNRRPHKNEPRVLRAFAAARELRDARLLLLGSASDELVQQIAALGLRDRVSFTGRVSDEELAAIYRGALAVLYPSLEEGFGLPIVEAMACGAPVVTSDVASMPEVSGGAAVLVDPRDVDSVAEGLSRALHDSELRAELVQKGAVNAARYTWARTGERLRDALQRAAQS